MDGDSSSMYDSAFGSLYNTDSASASVDTTSCNSGETASGQGERYEGMFSNSHISAIEEVLQNARARKNLAPSRQSTSQAFIKAVAVKKWTIPKMKL